MIRVTGACRNTGSAAAVHLPPESVIVGPSVAGRRPSPMCGMQP